ncbi:chorion class CA protein ERA.1-like [Vanessa tameamea]|uniref:Chorion class CA protein ERA.1-like n=1 Tax=Vanessa tameamea TaxID=334116 RepID=A0A8B8I0J9_VANTA
MSSLAFLILCVQACLVKNTFCQYIGAARYDGPLPGAIAPLGVGCAGPAYGLGAEFITPGITAYPAVAAYGGDGVGDVTVAGEMPVAGTTLVAGQVPILGAVRFAGELPAAGTVTITGNCGCGCGAAAYYY